VHVINNVSQTQISGNWRLRFLVAFNLERYKSSKTRKAKGKVVHSILKQIEIIGGRFLERHHVNAGFWLPAPKKIVRRKISHALRDKNPIPELNRAIPRLDILTNSLSWECNLQTEHIFNEINAALLRAIIPEGECFNDQCVEDILIDKLEEFINSRILNRPILQEFDDHEKELTRSNSLFQSYTKSMFITNINKCNSKNGKMTDQEKAVRFASESALYNFTRTPSHKGCSLELENEVCDPFDKDFALLMKLPHINLESTVLTLNDEMLSVEEDLPKDFTETEFECLVASLDHVTND
jgi:hypothetical protein